MPRSEGKSERGRHIPKPERNTVAEGRGRKKIGKSGQGKGGQKARNKGKKNQPEEMTIEKVLTKKVGSGPILQHYIQKMGLIEIVDRLVPKRANRQISNGEMVAAVMMYLLNDGRALYRMGQWAQETAILRSVFSAYQDGDWTDDRIGDTLDNLYKKNLEAIQGAISCHIVEEFGIKLDEIHYDTTSVSLWGTYDASAQQPAVVITFGYNKDHRSDLRQVVMGMAVSGDGGVPVISGTHNGNTSDSVLPIPYWERLRRVVGRSNFCFVGDCKIVSESTLAHLCGQDGQFLAPMPLSVGEQEMLVAQMNSGRLHLTPVHIENELRPIYERRTDCTSNRQRSLAEDEEGEELTQDTYEVCEQAFEIVDTQGRLRTLRKLIVYNPALAATKAKTRERHMSKAEVMLEKLRQRLNKRALKTQPAIEAAVNEILHSCKVPALLDVTVLRRVESIRKKVSRGRPSANSQYVMVDKITYDLQVARNQHAIQQKRLTDGFFLMATNMDKRQWTPEKLLSLYKRQYKVERVFHLMKTPLAVSPMLLAKPARICSMLFIMTLALQLYTLIQRQVAQQLLLRNLPLHGLMPNKIQTWRPQTGFLLAAFDNINLVELFTHESSSSVLTTLNPLQREILQLLLAPDVYSSSKNSRDS
jgi:transposase